MQRRFYSSEAQMGCSWPLSTQVDKPLSLWYVAKATITYSVTEHHSQYQITLLDDRGTWRVWTIYL